MGYMSNTVRMLIEYSPFFFSEACFPYFYYATQKSRNHVCRIDTPSSKPSKRTIKSHPTSASIHKEKNYHFHSSRPSRSQSQATTVSRQPTTSRGAKPGLGLSQAATALQRAASPKGSSTQTVSLPLPPGSKDQRPNQHCTDCNSI